MSQPCPSSPTPAPYQSVAQRELGFALSSVPKFPLHWSELPALVIQSPSESTAQKSTSPTTTSSDSGRTSDASQKLIERESRAYVCKVMDCKRRFAHLQQLRRHEKQHKRYTCVLCAPTVSYPHAKNLREHVQAIHRRLRYYCNVAGCSESVAQKKNLARHKASKHGL